MHVEPTEIPAVRLITPKKFADARGFFSETYSRAKLAAAGIALEFVQDNHSLSTQAGVIRGLHYQTPPFAQDKLVRVIRGSIVDVAVDLRRSSPTFGRHVCMTLSADNWQQALIPVGFAHGFCTLEPDTEVMYKVTADYAPQSERGILWNDPALGIAWPQAAASPVVSDKDLKNPVWAEVRDFFD